MCCAQAITYKNYLQNNAFLDPVIVRKENTLFKKTTKEITKK